MVIIMSVLKNPVTRILIIAVCAILVMFDIFIDVPLYNNSVKTVTNFGVVIAGFTVFFAATTLVIRQGKIIQKQTPGEWYYSLYGIGVIITVFVLAVLSTQNSAVEEIYGTLIREIISPLSSATYGIVGFYFTSSLFRSFRGRNSYVALFLLAGCFVIFANAPIFGLYPQLQSIGTWIRGVPGVAGSRGIFLGTAIGVIAAGLRTILGYERGAVGGEVEA